MPKFSTATGWKMCVLSKPAFLAALRVAAASAAEPAFVAESPMYDYYYYAAFNAPCVGHKDMCMLTNGR